MWRDKKLHKDVRTQWPDSSFPHRVPCSGSRSCLFSSWTRDHTIYMLHSICFQSSKLPYLSLSVWEKETYRWRVWQDRAGETQSMIIKCANIWWGDVDDRSCGWWVHVGYLVYFMVKERSMARKKACKNVALVKMSIYSYIITIVEYRKRTDMSCSAYLLSSWGHFAWRKPCMTHTWWH